MNYVPCRDAIEVEIRRSFDELLNYANIYNPTWDTKDMALHFYRQGYKRGLKDGRSRNIEDADVDVDREI